MLDILWELRSQDLWLAELAHHAHLHANDFANDLNSHRPRSTVSHGLIGAVGAVGALSGLCAHDHPQLRATPAPHQRGRAAASASAASASGASSTGAGPSGTVAGGDGGAEELCNGACQLGSSGVGDSALQGRRGCYRSKAWRKKRALWHPVQGIAEVTCLRRHDAEVRLWVHGTHRPVDPCRLTMLDLGSRFSSRWEPRPRRSTTEEIHDPDPRSTLRAFEPG